MAGFRSYDIRQGELDGLADPAAAFAPALAAGGLPNNFDLIMNSLAASVLDVRLSA